MDIKRKPENYIRIPYTFFVEMMKKYFEEENTPHQKILEISPMYLLLISDAEFKAWYKRTNTQCFCSIKHHNQIIYRAFKLGLEQEYKPI